MSRSAFVPSRLRGPSTTPTLSDHPFLIGYLLARAEVRASRRKRLRRWFLTILRTVLPARLCARPDRH